MAQNDRQDSKSFLSFARTATTAPAFPSLLKSLVANEKGPPPLPVEAPL